MADVRPIGQPMSVTDDYWLFERDSKAGAKCHYDPELSGKWMMFWDNAVLDEKWKQAVILYREGKLTGIHGMKVSTKRDNKRARDNTSGVIIFYCGPGVASKAYSLFSFLCYLTSMK